MSDEPDRITLERARRREASAQAHLLRCLQDRLWRVCRSLLSDRSAAEDALQETALRVLAGLPGFDGRSRVATWATGIAINVCREQRRRRTVASLESQPHAFAPPAPPGEATPAEELERLYTAMSRLPERQREAVALRYLEGLDVRQTAELMGCADGTVKAAVHAGIKNLRRMMEEAM